MTHKSSISSNKSNGRLAKIIEKNIRTIINNRQVVESQRTGEDRLADQITDFSGRMYFVYFHLAWFGVWILINLGFF